ncbi:MAG: helix-turn-helix transcriptional regulator [Bacteroidaceae bacterium]|nr:helix-turn-helix transcriptional regulator [Bacteroidaceae bacterium]
MIYLLAQKTKRVNQNDSPKCLRIALVKKKRTGKWLAEQLGKSNCTVSKWCSNSAQPDLKTLAKIADLLNMDLRNLLTEDK